MTPILEILLEATRPKEPPEPFQEKLDRFMVLENQLQEQLGWQFTMDLESAWDELHAAELDRAYEEGFLTAFRLRMEVSALRRGAL